MPRGSAALMALTVEAALAHAEESLRNAGVENARVDAEIVVGHVLHVSRSQLAVEGGRLLVSTQEEQLAALVERRCTREPLQYVLGEWGFRRLTLNVDSRALIPRPETEVVVERALALLAGRVVPAVLDVGSGSGAIALAIADEHRGSRVLGIDSSADAVALARENAERCKLDVDFAAHDLFDGLPTGPWDLVVSNPPYVPLDDRPELAPEVRDWEPAEALHGSSATQEIARETIGVLEEGGALVLEVGDGQAGDVAGLLRSLGYADVRVTLDLTGRERVVEGRR
jgi:release factor glutamine methyltransferase